MGEVTRGRLCPFPAFCRLQGKQLTRGWKEGGVVLEPPFFAFIPLSAFDLPLALGGHYTSSLLPPSLLSPVTLVLSRTFPPTRPLNHPTKLIDTFCVTPFPVLPAFTLHFPIPHRPDDRLSCKYAGGRPALYEVTTHLRAHCFAHKECPLRTRISITTPVTASNRQGNQCHHKWYPRRCRRVQQRTQSPST